MKRLKHREIKDSELCAGPVLMQLHGYFGELCSVLRRLQQR